MSDQNNYLVPVANPDANGCWRHVSVKAGKPSILCSDNPLTPALTLGGDLDLNGYDIVDNNPTSDKQLLSILNFGILPETALGVDVTAGTALVTTDKEFTGLYYNRQFSFSSSVRLENVNLTAGNALQLELTPVFPLDMPPIQGSGTAQTVGTFEPFDGTITGGIATVNTSWNTMGYMVVDIQFNGLITKTEFLLHLSGHHTTAPSV
jgi:hypothetical protein